MSGSAKDWGHGKKVKKLKTTSRDGELNTTKGKAKNPTKEKDSPMSTPV